MNEIDKQQIQSSTSKILEGVKELSSTPVAKLALPFAAGILTTLVTQKVVEHVKKSR